MADLTIQKNKENTNWGNHIEMIHQELEKFQTLGDVLNMSEINQQMDKSTRATRKNEKQNHEIKMEEKYQEELEKTKHWEIPMEKAGWSEEWKTIFEQEEQDKNAEDGLYGESDSGYDSDGHYVPGNWGW